jgi:Predicted metal-dependent phosphoesterases (PHP family)
MGVIMQTVTADRVTFCRPDWNDLREKGINAADMHFHTRYSDSYTDVKKAVKLAEQRNVGFAITDHNLIGGVLEASEIETDVTMIPGIEISAWDGPHILVYFYDVRDLKEYWTNNIKENIQRSPYLAITKDTEWILDSLEDENCVVSAAHPMGYLGFNKGMQKCINKHCLCEQVTERVDAYEVICSGMSRSGNLRSRECADRYGLGYTGGTDGHLMRELGNVVTCTEEQGIDGMLDSIKKKSNFVIGTEKSFPSKVEMGVVTMTQYFRYIPSSLVIHYRQNITRLTRRR